MSGGVGLVEYWDDNNTDTTVAFAFAFARSITHVDPTTAIVLAALVCRCFLANETR